MLAGIPSLWSRGGMALLDQALLDTYQQDSGNECLRKEFCVLGAL